MCLNNLNRDVAGFFGLFSCLFSAFLAVFGLFSVFFLPLPFWLVPFKGMRGTPGTKNQSGHVKSGL